MISGHARRGNRLGYGNGSAGYGALQPERVVAMETYHATTEEHIAVPIRMLTACQVAKMYQVSAKTVYRWAKHGTIPAFREGRIVRFSQQDVEQHILCRSGNGLATP